MPRPRQRPTVYPVHLEGGDTAIARPVLLDSAAVCPGSPIWVELVDQRRGYWVHCTILRLEHAIIHVRPVTSLP